ncbi:MAG: response regulator [Gammaproteobacteria bacterium]|nr:response regulator [Gammaproteobacteria bacterium]
MKRALLIKLTLIIALGGMFLLVREVVVENIKLTNASVVKVEEDHLKQLIREWKRDLEMLANNGATRDMVSKYSLKKDNLKERKRLEKLFKHFLSSRLDYIKSIRLIGSNGREMVVVIEDGALRNYMDVSGEAYFKRAMTRRPLDIDGRLTTRKLGDTVLAYTITLAFNGKVASVLTIDIDVDSIFKFSRDASDKNSFNHAYLFTGESNLVYDKRLRVTSEPSDREIAKKVYAEIHNSGHDIDIMVHRSTLWAYIENSQLNSSLLLEMDNRFLYQRILEIFLPISVIFLLSSMVILFLNKKKKRFVRKGVFIVPESATDKSHKKKSNENVIRLKDLANISNQIRIPVNNILGTLSLLRVSESPEKRKEYLDITTRYSEWIIELLNEITDYAALKKGTLQLEQVEFSIRQIINDVVEILSTEAYNKGIEVINIVRSDVPDRILGDPTRVRQILVNLVGNAIKSSEQGDISINVTMTKAKKDRCTIRLEVCESNVGTETEFAFTMFAEFDKSHTIAENDANQSLFGINISKQLIEMMGGSIGYSDNALGGNTFWLEAPFKLAIKSEPSIIQTQLKGLRVLITGERESNRKSAAVIFSGWGINCDTTSNFERILEALERKNEIGRRYDILLIDISTTALIEKAFALVKSLKSHALLGNTKIIILTSKVVSGYEQVARNFGVEAFLIKPINRSQLKEALLEAIKVDSEVKQLESNDIVTTYSASDRNNITSPPILIVEPDSSHQKQLTGMVARHGLGANIASSGQEALVAIESHHYDLLILDSQLPDFSAVDIISDVRKLERKMIGKKKNGDERIMKTPIIIIVDKITDKEHARYKKYGVDDFLYKPVTRDSMEEIFIRWDIVKPGDES